MKLRLLILSLVWLSVFSDSYALDLNLDSLKQQWTNTSLSDTVRLEALQKIARDVFVFSQRDSALHYARVQYDFAKARGLKFYMMKALSTQGEAFYGKAAYDTALTYYARSMAIAKEIDSQKGIAFALNNMGIVHEIRGDLSEALESYNESLEIFEQIDFQKGVIGALNNKGVVYQIQGDYSNAIAAYMRCLTLGEQIGNQQYVLTFLNNIGLIYMDHKEYPEALDYLGRALKIAEEVEYKPGMAFILNNMGTIFEAQDQTEQALEYFTRCLSIRKEINERQGLVSVLGNIGAIYKKQGRLKEAFDYQAESLAIAREISFQEGIASALNQLGMIYKSQGKITTAIRYSSDALAVAEKLGSIKQIKAASENLYELYERTGNYSVSLDMYQLFVLMRDSIENIEGQKEVISQAFKYEYEKQALSDSLTFMKQRELEVFMMEAKANKRYMILGGIVFILILIGNYFRVRALKNEAEKATLLHEIKLLKVDSFIKMSSGGELNEHFVLDKEKIEKAISNPLNPSDWNILKALYHNPSIGNKEIADEVSLSVAGVRSSLQKMYRFFYIDKSANQRVLLVMEATKISNR